MIVQNFDSSLIKSIAYESRVLTVLFTNGKMYAYDKVPKRVFEDFCSAQSKGKYFNENIRGEYDSEEITGVA